MVLIEFQISTQPLCPKNRHISEDQSPTQQGELGPEQGQSEAGCMDLQINAEFCQDEDAQELGLA